MENTLHKKHKNADLKTQRVQKTIRGKFDLSQIAGKLILLRQQKDIISKDIRQAILPLHCIKYARIRVFTDCILPYKDKIYDFVLIRENTSQ